MTTIGVDRLVADASPATLDTPAPPPWRRVDLDAFFRGDIEPELPRYLTRDDDQKLLYPGRIHSLAGEPESGKSWLLAAACVETIKDGGVAAFLNLEGTPRELAARLRALGLTSNELHQFIYLEADGALRPPELYGWLDELGPVDLIGIDSFNELVGLFGFEILSNRDITTLRQELLAPIARTGAAVALIDHVTKDTERRGRWPIGAQAKLASVDVAFSLQAVRPFGRNFDGESRLVVTKDRPGALRPAALGGRRIAKIEYCSWPDEAVDVRVVAPSDEQFRPTGLMGQITEILKSTDRPLSQRDILDRVRGRKTDFKRQALAYLIDAGTVITERGPRGATLHKLAESDTR